MSKFEYAEFEGWERLMLHEFRLKENAKIKQIKDDETQSDNTKSLNIMGQQGWELISSPTGVGRVNLVFKKKI
tara:strand:+ start:7823 stop:8041 length:219 start_codon:yes stop_codon:yes gene_type:complete